MALLLEFRNLREIGEKSTGNVKPSEDRQGRQGLCQGRHCLPCLIAGYVPGRSMPIIFWAQQVKIN